VGKFLEKKVALFTAYEIIVALDKAIPADSIIIGPDPKISKSPDDHVIKIKHDLEESHVRIIAEIAEKRNLKIEKLDDTFIIH
jgi:hypothetical protein